MAESRMTDQDDATDALWALIPWYVNGTLDDDETRAVERRRDSDPAFAAEIDQQSALAAGIAAQEMPDLQAAESRSLASLKARIAAEDRARGTATGGQGWWAALAGWLPGLGGGGGLAVAGTACAALLAVLVLSGVMTGSGPETPQGDFRTLTSDPDTPGAFIKFQPAGDVSRDALERLLAAHGLALVGDASETGVFRARAREGMDTDALAGTLMQAEEILFAAPE